MMISFLARSAVVVLVGFVADQIGLEKTYTLCATVGFLSIPFVLKITKGNSEKIIKEPQTLT
jgi:FSR family fosmidomycin resistance protein-like MFS transporter